MVQPRRGGEREKMRLKEKKEMYKQSDARTEKQNGRYGQRKENHGTVSCSGRVSRFPAGAFQSLPGVQVSIGDLELVWEV